VQAANASEIVAGHGAARGPRKSGIDKGLNGAFDARSVAVEGVLDVARTINTIVPVSVAAAALLALASCGDGDDAAAGGEASGGAGAGTEVAQGSQLFPDNFEGVCSGASVSTAAAYDAAAKGHKALYFATYEDDFLDQSSSLPGDWTVQWSPDADALRAIDLVACARRTAAQEVRVCDGYENDGKPTQNKVRWHTATYELSVREATTGNELAKTTLEATDSDCPMFQSFDSDTQTVDGYASLPDSAVADFLRPHMGG
jgi:hypothetical protein